MFRSRAELEADELKTVSHAHGAQPLSECQAGEQVDACGVIRSITIRPQGSVPALQVDLFDGTRSIDVIWLGRRRIAGIDAGRMIVVHGRLTCNTESPTIYNPRYELLPRTS